MANLAIQLSLGIPCLYSPRMELQMGCSLSILGALSSKPQIFMFLSHVIQPLKCFLNKKAFAVSIRSYTYKILRACIPALVRKSMVQKEEDLSLDPQNL